MENHCTPKYKLYNLQLLQISSNFSGISGCMTYCTVYRHETNNRVRKSMKVDDSLAKLLGLYTFVALFFVKVNVNTQLSTETKNTS
jgi:hypothetical protein